MKFLFACLIFCCHLSAHPALVVVRHGQGEHNPQSIISSWTQEEGGIDHCLTPKGREQVALTAEKLLEQGVNRENVGLVLVSPMRRTRETAQILIDHGVCSEKVLHIEERIREPVACDWEGQPLEELLKICPDLNCWADEVLHSAEHGGESPESVQNRVTSILDQLSTWDSRNGYVILVTHGYPSQLLFRLLGMDKKLGTAEHLILN